MKTTTLAERIKTRRSELGLTVEDLADAAGVSVVAVRKWESGATNNLKHEHLFDMCEALNVQPRWLALGTGEKTGNPTREAYTVALSRREMASDARVRSAWERIAMVFAKAAAIAFLAIGTLLSPPHADAHGLSVPNYSGCVLCKIAAWISALFSIMRNSLVFQTYG